MKHPFLLRMRRGESRFTGRSLICCRPASILVDLDGRVRDVNPAFCRWMGFTRDELIGIHVSHFSNDAPGDIERNLARLRGR